MGQLYKDKMCQWNYSYSERKYLTLDDYTFSKTKEIKEKSWC